MLLKIGLLVLHYERQTFWLVSRLRDGLEIEMFLHLREIEEGLCFHCSLSVCLCVCPAMLVNKIQAKRMNRFGRSLH